MDEHLIIFAKAPIPGLAKTRLFPHLSFEEAAELHRAFLFDTVEKAACLQRMKVCLAYTPKKSLDMFKQVFGDRVSEYLPQEGDDLGERMGRAFERAFEKGAKKAAVIGTDTPTLPAYYLSAAFNRLEDSDLVIGPAKDGGYYLVGMKRPLPGLFDGISWSGPKVYKQTLVRADELGLKVEALPPLHDVDTFDDLRRLLGVTLPPNTKKLIYALAQRLKAKADWLV